LRATPGYSPPRQLGIAEIPVMVAAGWSEAQKRAYVLADNQLAITGSGWDPELLRLELGELKLGGFDLSLTGFGDLELKDLLAERTGGLTDPDDAPAAPEHPSAGVVQPHSLMLAAIAATWASVWVRAFLAYGISRSIAQRSTLSAGHGL
jgi:hypothetical protein